MKTSTHTGDRPGLGIRDLVTTGVFTALFFVFTMAGTIFFAPNPVLTFLVPAGAALLTGPIYLLLIAKIPKHGPIIILGTIVGLFSFMVGMYWLASVFSVVLSIIADFIAGMGRFRNQNLNLASFLVFSLSAFGSYTMLWIDPAGYESYLIGKGAEQTYMDTMMATATDWMLPAMIVLTLVCALISGLVGRRLLRKQFEKAGITG